MNTLQKTKLRGTGINCGLIVLLFAVVLLLGQVLPQNTYRRVLVPIIWQMCIFILLGTSLNLTLGYLGQLTLGHMGFAGVGAYTAALTSLALERAGLFEASKAAPGQLILVILGCCLLGAIFAGLLGLLVGIPALRLHGDYLAIVTLACGEIIKNIITNLNITGGALGLDTSSIYAGAKDLLPYGAVLVLLTVAVMLNLKRSKYGRAIMAIRDNRIAAESVGLNVTWYKLAVFVIAAFFAGCAGVLYGHSLANIKAAAFDYNMSIEILVIVVLGGMGSVPGSVISAIVLTVLPEALREVADYRMLVYAIVLILVMQATNNPTMKRFFASAKEKLTPGRKERAAL